MSDGKLANINGKYYPVEAAEQLRVVIVPILGTIAAGVPIEAIQDLDGYVGYLLQGHHRDYDLYALHVHGNSMIEVHNRMPVVLLRGERDTWLNSERSAVEILLAKRPKLVRQATE